jgi:hypothetical protein
MQQVARSVKVTMMEQLRLVRESRGERILDSSHAEAHSALYSMSLAGECRIVMTERGREGQSVCGFYQRHVGSRQQKEHEHNKDE